MLNENLFNSDDIEKKKLLERIKHLENTITQFKEYDKQRVAYYKDAMIKLGELESFVDEIMEKDKLAQKLARQKEQLRILQDRVILDKIARLSDIEVVSSYEKITTEKKIKEIKTKYKQLKSNFDTLLSRYFQLLKLVSPDSAPSFESYVEDIDD
jgi:DNA repair exonuclease SbcCD ATPase subunit